MFGTRCRAFLFFPGCKFVFLIFAIASIVTWSVLKILEIQNPGQTGLLKLIQVPYRRRFGSSKSKVSLEPGRFPFVFSEAVEVGLTRSSSNRDFSQGVCHIRTHYLLQECQTNGQSYSHKNEPVPVSVWSSTGLKRLENRTL
ncbi:hypothetical protein CRM22_001652 [Opisthorchis felineus]|uniref:Uncharacterized protein n=1 Tax=Opisthorchis felineus TaxID=147828 RepID=A0A4S2M9W9_OPIFE|nr:hypothetical protein CRM22_001652 [Opisthorchis felineus]